MDERIPPLESMLDKTTAVLAGIDDSHLERPTPCSEYSVDELADHVAVWATVFASAVNESELDIDPFTHRIGTGRVEAFERSARSIVDGLTRLGADRPMTMTADPLPGEMVLNMLLMEYIGHGWDLASATGQPVPYSDDEAAVALAAARAIILPEYRGTGMFGDEVAVEPAAGAMAQLVGFLGRDPAWAPSPVAAG